MRKLYIIILLVLSHVAVGEVPVKVPARRAPFEREQPNGEHITILLCGDEWHHWSITLDRYQVLEDDKGYIYYATEKRKEIVASKRIAHNEQDRTRCEKRWLRRHGIKK